MLSNYCLSYKKQNMQLHKYRRRGPGVEGMLYNPDHGLLCPAPLNPSTF